MMEPGIQGIEGADRRFTDAAKRAFDVIFSVCSLVVSLPVFILAAIAIKVSSPGPVLFRQERIGKAGVPFELLKFRSMHVEARESIETSSGDRSVFLAGRVLREFHIDELPQLLNVLKGHMSIVGPRPTIPAQVARYSELERERLLVRPGLTGLAQVGGNNLLSWEERIELDRQYVHNYSLSADCRILIRTVGVVIRRKGVYGPEGKVLDKPNPTSDRTR